MKLPECDYAASRMFHVRDADEFRTALSTFDVEVESQIVDGNEEVFIYNEDGAWPTVEPDSSEMDPDFLTTLAEHLQPDSVAILETVVFRESAYTEMNGINSRGEKFFMSNDLMAEQAIALLGGNARNEVR